MTNANVKKLHYIQILQNGAVALKFYGTETIRLHRCATNLVKLGTCSFLVHHIAGASPLWIVVLPELRDPKGQSLRPEEPRVGVGWG